MKRRLAAAAAALALAATLAGCASGGSPDSDDGAGKGSTHLYERSIELTDGRDVTCVVWANGRQGGVSCDWASAGQQLPTQ